MTKRMLIDATHAEETRVVVLDGSRLEDFDVETSTKRHLKGNIYLAKVVRVEPSLQAAFVEYGGNRHGFLAFSEIHPDYYQIPVADRQRLLDMQAEEARQDEEAEDRAAADEERGSSAATAPPLATPAPLPATQPSEALATETPESETLVTEGPAAGGSGERAEAGTPAEADAAAQPAAIPHDIISGPWLTDAALAGSEPETAGTVEGDADMAPAPDAEPDAEEPATADGATGSAEDAASEPPLTPTEPELAGGTPGFGATPVVRHADDTAAADLPEQMPGSSSEPDGESLAEEPGNLHVEPAADLPPPETVGGDGDATEEARDRRIPPRYLRNYKIQEVIKRRQILLVQVVKEERGTKGAALTTYISLAGRYCVLMPNSPRGGGISRKITAGPDRRRLKEIMSELDIPPGMGLIVRTAGANRPKAEIKRDCEYLMRLWDDIRDHTMRSVAPALIYEEASLIKRAIRDVYSRDLDEIVVDGEDGWRAARDFMRMVMPSHAKKVQLWRDGGQPLLARYQVDAQLDAMLLPIVQLKSGGYLVINQTEALVAIDVNSGRSTRERGIEETALRTNLEAADEVARQLRLRDLAGLIVIDFIDMESKKNNGLVERRLKEALKNDRARIQVGHISHFGLLEMSCQRLRPSLAETSFSPCPHCGGSGHVRSTESSAIHVLRQIEDEGAKRRAAEAVVHAASSVVMYVLNHKRERLAEVETRHGLHVVFAIDDGLIPPQIRIDRVRAAVPSELPPAITPEAPPVPLASDVIEGDRIEADEAEDEEDVAETDMAEPEMDSEAARSAGEAGGPSGGTSEAGEADQRRRRRRRRRRGRRDGEGTAPDSPVEPAPAGDPTLGETVGAADAATPETEEGPWTIEGAPEQADEAQATESARDRSRSRRGGRRRRREPSGEEPVEPMAQPGVEQPDVPYSGPTPADPFGGQVFDIFDMMEHASVPARAPVPVPAEPVPSAAASLEMPASEAAGAVEGQATQEADAPVSVESGSAATADRATDAVAIVEAEPNPGSDTSRPASEEEPSSAPEAASLQPTPDPQPPTPEPANDTAPEPVIQPIIVGAESEASGEKKRGWWRR